MRLTKKEIAQIALDYIENRIFTSAGLATRELSMVFMPLLFMAEKDCKKVKTWGMIYEYINKAGPSSINGKPIFFSFHVLLKDEYTFFIECVEKLEKVKQTALKELEK